MGRTQPRQVIRESRFWLAYSRRRYTILFYSLLVTLIAIPAAATIGLPTTLIKFLVSASLLVAVMPNATKRTRYLLLAAVLLLVLGRFASDEGALRVNPAFLMVAVGLMGLAAAAGALR
jgi:hypothetical protein